MIDEPGLISAHSEEVVLLGDFKDLPVTVRALALGKIFFGPEPFAGNAVPSRVVCLIDLATVVEVLKDLLDDFFMPIFSRPDEVVVGDVEPLPEGLKPFDHLVAVSLRIDPPLLRSLFHFLAMFIRAGEKEGLIPFEPLESGEDIGCHGGIGMADMGNIINIVDGCGDIEGALRFRMHGS
jgi:hypothetical protein